MEPDVNIAVKPRRQTKPPRQTGQLIALRNERARTVARDARLAKALTLAAMSLGYVVVQLDVTIVNVAINSIGADFGGSVAGLQWIVNAYTITFAAFILTAGALGDRLGARRVFIAGFTTFVLASLACALAPALPVLIVWPAYVRALAQQFSSRIRWRCSITPIRKTASAAGLSGFGPLARASR